MVPQPPQVHPLYRLAQLQMANHQGNDFHPRRFHDFAVLLFHSGLYRKEASWSLSASREKQLIYGGEGRERKRGNNINLRKKLCSSLNENFEDKKFVPHHINEYESAQFVVNVK